MQEIDSLILAFLNREISQDDFLRLKTWTLASEAHCRYVRNKIETWFSASVSVDDTPFDAEEAWARFQLRKDIHQSEQPHSEVTADTVDGQTSADNEEKASARIFTFFVSKPMRWVATAAAVIVLLVVVRHFSFQSGVNSVQKQFASIETEVPAGSNLHLTLPDGTRVYLNSATKLSYNQGYGIDNREVTLSGEGYFEVAHDGKLPFVIHSDKVTVRDIGTAFRVCNYREDNLATVELHEGRVLIDDDISLKPDSSLLPGQRMQIDKRSGQRFTMNITDRPKAGTVDFNHLDFNDVTLSQIANVLSRQYDVKISVADSQRDKRFYGVFNRKQSTIDQVLQLMQETGHIRYKKAGDVYYIY